MAKVRVLNLTSYLLVIPRPLNLRLRAHQSVLVDVIDVDGTFNDPRIIDQVRKGQLKVVMVKDDTPDTGATLPFYTTAQLPVASENAGMMVYNVTDEMVQYSDGTSWLAVETIPTFTGAPPAASFPPGYLIWEKDSQSLFYNGGSTWLRTTANGVDVRPGHVFPVPTSVPAGTIMIDSDTKQLRVSDGDRWLYPSYAQDYSSYSSLPLPTNVAVGNLAYVSDSQSLFIRIGGAWLSTAAALRYYATAAALPDSSTYGTDERGVVAYIDDDRAVVVWDGKYWRYMTQVPHYPTISLPDANNYSDGHLILNEDFMQSLVAWGGKWEGLQGTCRPYTAAGRPKNSDVPEGTCVWNITSNKANWNIGGSWVDASGVVDP